MKPIRNGLRPATLTQLNQARHNGQRVSTYLGIQGLFRLTSGEVLNLHFFHKEISVLRTIAVAKVTKNLSLLTLLI
jgi:hypothetical protein